MDKCMDKCMDKMELAYQPTVRFKLITKITDKDGHHPVKLRLTYLRKNFDRTTGIAASELEWDIGASRIRGKKRKDDNILLEAMERKAKNLILNYQLAGRRFIPLKILDEILGDNTIVTSNGNVFEFYLEVINDLKTAGKIKTAESFKYSLSLLKKFHPKGLDFTQIDFSFLDKFRTFLLATHSLNGASVVLRALRSIYNKALAYGKFKPEEYPFKKLSIKSQPTRKRAIRKEEMVCIAEKDIDYGTRLWHSRNYFIFSYLTQGMNFKDIVELRWVDIVDNKITYRRSKTGDLFFIAINDKIKQLLGRYQDEFRSEDGFIFPILKANLSPTQKADRLKKRLSQVNKDLKEIANLCKIDSPQSISFYVARHSYATALKKLGYSTSIISDAMGHSDERTTQIYLASFDNSVFEEANAKLL